MDEEQGQGPLHAAGWDYAWKVIDQIHAEFGNNQQGAEVIVSAGISLLSIVAAAYPDEEHVAEQLNLYDKLLAEGVFSLRQAKDEEKGDDTDSSEPDSSQ